MKDNNQLSNNLLAAFITIGLGIVILLLIILLGRS